MVHSFELILIGCLIFLSAFLSASEVALFTLSRFQLRYLKENFRPIFIQIKKLLADPSSLLVTILVTNEIINISIATTVEHIVLRSWGETDPDSMIVPLKKLVAHLPEWMGQLLIGVMLTVPVVLIACEITPKVLAARANHVIAPLTSTTLLWLHTLLTPIRVLISFFVGILLGKKFRRKIEVMNPTSGTLIREEEFLFMIEEGHREGIVHSSELELIRNIFELDDTKAEEICTPLSKVYSLPRNSSLKQALDGYKTKPFSRIPVFDGDRNQITGVLFTKDLIPARLDPSQQHLSVESLMRRPLYLKQGMRLNALFRTMRQNHAHMAIVVNSSDKAIGVVTMNDVLAEIFGEFFEGNPKPRGVIP